MNEVQSTAAGSAAMVDADHPAVLAMARTAIGGATNPRDRAVKLYPRMARLDDASWEQDVAGEARG